MTNYVNRHEWEALREELLDSIEGELTEESIESFLDKKGLLLGQVVSTEEILKEIYNDPQLLVKKRLQKLALELKDIAKFADEADVHIPDIGLYTTGLGTAIELCGWNASSLSC